MAKIWPFLAQTWSKYFPSNWFVLNLYTVAPRLLQLNSSNADWSTKQDELLSTIVDNEAELTVVSEANLEVYDNNKTATTNSKFKEYKIESKTLAGQNKARVAVVLQKTSNIPD